MYKSQHQKIDGFIIVLFITAVALAALLIVTFKGIFTSVIVTYETEEGRSNDSRVNKESLDEAYKKVFEKNYEKLDI